MRHAKRHQGLRGPTGARGAEDRRALAAGRGRPGILRRGPRARGHRHLSDARGPLRPAGQRQRSGIQAVAAERRAAPAARRDGSVATTRGRPRLPGTAAAAAAAAASAAGPTDSEAGPRQITGVDASQADAADPPGPMRVHAIVRDLMFAARIVDAAQRAGAELRRVAEPADLPPPSGTDLVLVDWTDRGADWAAALRAWRDSARAGAARPPRLVLFGSHADLPAHREAREAGIGPVMARSQFVSLLPGLLRAKSPGHG